MAAGGSTLMEGISMVFALSLVMQQVFVVGSDNQLLIVFDMIVVDDIGKMAEAINSISFVFNQRELNQTPYFIARDSVGLFFRSVPAHLAGYVLNLCMK